MTDTSSNSESGSSEGEPLSTEPLSTVPPEAQEASEDFSAARVKVKYSEQRSASLQDPEPDFGDGADADRLDGLDGLDGADGAGEDLEADVRDLACVIIVSSCIFAGGPIFTLVCKLCRKSNSS